MAPRRSPRASGSSSGSSSGRAPGSAPRGSGSPGSPRSPEFPDDSDSGSDFAASPRPRSKRGPARAAPGSRAPKRSRLSRGAGRGPEQNSLFEAVFSGKVATETLVDEWLERYRRDREGAFLELLNFTVRSCGCRGEKLGKNSEKMGKMREFLELLNFTVRSCGCRGVVTPEMFRELQNSEIIRRLTETFQEDSPEYPLSMTSPEWRRFRSGFSELLAVLWRRFRAGFCELLAVLVVRAQHRELHDGFLWRRFRSGFSELLSVLVLRAQHRELHDGFLVGSLLSFLTGLADSQVRPFRHTGTLAALKLMSSLVELQEQQQELELLMNGIFKGVFVHRYRDVVPEIRALCMEELGAVEKWGILGSFLTDSHLKYLGWTLHDKQGEVRLRCVRALRGIYGTPELAPSLELFTNRFKPRLVAMAHDREPQVALEVLRLLTDMDRNLEEALTAEDRRGLFPVVFVANRELAAAAGALLSQRLLGDGAGDSRSFLLGLARFFLQAELHEHAAYLVDAVWDCAGGRLRDWDAATALLLGTALQLHEEKALVEILSCSALRLCQGHPPVGRSLARKVSPRERREQREERERLSRCLIPVLPQLLQKFSAEPEAVAALLELLQHLELGLFRTARMERHLEQVLGQIQEVFAKHSQPFPALSAASRALRALSDPELPLHGLGATARGRLGDALGDRCHLQVTEMLQAVSPDEEDVYALAATLRRLSALFNDHDLTPCGLFVPLAQLLRRSLDSGELGGQVTVPALSCLFFHIFWELSRVCDSGASPGSVRDLRSRASLLLSLCQSCLAEPEPALREKAFLVLSDLLLLLGPGLPEPGLRLRPEPELGALLGGALLDLVFNDEPETEPEDQGETGSY
ncbi:cohesin subunit SA-3-like [Zonotrichia albicollis]|uniref:cohesin subunit SA-3-like n=1 Tax=Zonotrichia albicollis TaxID=44394 RepID=UPI003D80F766